MGKGETVMLDPRIEDNAKKINKLKKAILILTGNVDGIAWRVSSEEERKAGMDIYNKIKELLEDC